MKRDMDLARSILIEVEAATEPWGMLEINVDGYEAENISYHIKLLYQAGLIEAEDTSTLGVGGFEWSASSLTWDGHEFLEAARDDNRWDKAKDVILKKGAGMPFDVLMQVLVKMISG